MFTHLHGHSHYSLLEAIGKPKDIITTAKELGMDAIALTDYSGMYGAIEFYKAATKADIKPILGVELGWTINLSSKQSQGTIVLIAPDTQRYHNLLKLTSHANMEGYTSMATIDLNLLKQYGEGLICIVGGDRSIITHEPDQSKLIEQLQLIQSAVGTSGKLVLELVARDHDTNKTLFQVNNQIVGLSQKLDVDYIISGNFHYISHDQSRAFETAMGIKDGKRIYDEDRRLVTGKRHIQTENEIRNTMLSNGFDESVVDLGITNTAKIADMTYLEIELNKLLFPNYQSPQEIKDLYKEHHSNLVVG